MDLLLPAHRGLMNQLLDCLVRWETMQSSTVTYAENASLDLIEAETCCEEHLGVLDAALLPEIRGAAFASADKMLRGLRRSLEAFERISETLDVLESKARKKLKPSRMYEAMLLEWIEDCTRMLQAELIYNRLILTMLDELDEPSDIEQILLSWVEEPHLDRALLEHVKEVLAPSPD